VKTTIKHVERNKNEICCFYESRRTRHLLPRQDALEQQPCSWCFPLRESTNFHPKTPILIPLTPKFVYTLMNLKRQSKPFKTWNQNIIPKQIINSPIFHKTFKNNSIVMNTRSMNHQQQHLITTTISINHEFINNPTTTISYSTNFELNTTYPYTYILSM